MLLILLWTDKCHAFVFSSESNSLTIASGVYERTGNNAHLKFVDENHCIIY
uniref:Uncharacterized protein n=1 Tax=Anguilla anguilla TaxID=7936 RepID=A0A0E9V2S5_ANGAN